MINTLFLLSHTEKGGGEVAIYNLIKNLNRSQFRPFLGHVDFHKGSFIHEFRKLGVEPVDFHASRLRNLPVAFCVALRLARFIKSNFIDIIFTSGAHNHIYAALAKRLIPVPIVSYVMDYYQKRIGDNALVVRAALCLKADYYLTASYSCLEPLKCLIPLNTPSQVVYHGVDRDFINGSAQGASIRERLGLKENAKLVSIICRLQRWKGQDVFIRAASLIAKPHPQVYFCITGGALFGMEQGYPDELSRLIEELGLTGRCWMVGHQDNVKDWILASDIIVHAARAPEPGATVVMEAMSLGKPVVATSCGAPSELISDRISGLLCQPDSPEDLAVKVTELLDNENLAYKIGRSAQEIAAERFSAERMSREMEEVLMAVLAH